MIGEDKPKEKKQYKNTMQIYEQNITNKTFSTEKVKKIKNLTVVPCSVPGSFVSIGPGVSQNSVSGALGKHTQTFLPTTSDNGFKRVSKNEEVKAEIKIKRKFKSKKYFWKLKEVIGALLKNSKYAVDKLGRSAVSRCGCIPLYPAYNSSNYAHYVEGQSGNHYFTGMEHCKKVWLCPICSSKIAEERRDDLLMELQERKKQGYNVAFLTLTFSHSRCDVLGDGLDLLNDGWNYVSTHRQMRGVNCEYFRSIEITVGNNGWHPHVHAILIYNKGIDVLQAGKKMQLLWFKWLERKKLDKAGMRERSFVFKNILNCNISEVADYVTKVSGLSGLSYEVSNNNNKFAKNNNVSAPFELMRYEVEDKELPFVWKSAKTLFIEYAAAVKGRHKYQWSKRFFTEDVKEDAQVCNDDEINKKLFGITWRVYMPVAMRAEQWIFGWMYDSYGRVGLEWYMADVIADAKIRDLPCPVVFFDG